MKSMTLFIPIPLSLPCFNDILLYFFFDFTVGKWSGIFKGSAAVALAHLSASSFPIIPVWAAIHRISFSICLLLICFTKNVCEVWRILK